jgi:hypothetical protein
MASASPVSKVRVLTYNVLSSHLCGPSYFTKCTPKALDPTQRYKKLIRRLEKEVKGHPQPVICLQEVSRPWSGKLTAWFSERNYAYVPSLYGRAYNGYMGCAIAVPLKSFSIQDCKVERVSETQTWCPSRPEKAPRSDAKATKRSPKKRKKDKRQEVPKSWWEKCWDAMWPGPSTELEDTTAPSPAKVEFPPSAKTVEAMKAKEQEDFEYWHKAKDRHNTAIAVRLKGSPSSGEFWVGTYHMPCAFWSPPLMTIHTALVAQFMEACAGALPFVLAGDFNFSPTHPQYRFLMDGKLGPGDSAMPQRLPYDDVNWDPALRRGPLKSAYKEFVGAEPDCTNYAYIKNGPAFVDTLDYVFISDGIAVTGAREIPHRDLLNGPLPNKQEESDHLAVCVDLEVDSRARM